MGGGGLQVCVMGGGGGGGGGGGLYMQIKTYENLVHTWDSMIIHRLFTRLYYLPGLIIHGMYFHHTQYFILVHK